jgi:DNA polymerase-3 subunit delta'
VLLDRLGGEIPTLDFFVSYSGGVIGSALEAAASPHFLQFREQVWDLIQALPDLHGTGVSSRTQLFEDNREDIDKILDIMASFFRDLLLVKSCRNENMLINFDKKDIILKNAPRFQIEGLLWFMSTVEETRRFIRQNVNYQLAIEVMLMKLQEVF